MESRIDIGFLDGRQKKVLGWVDSLFKDKTRKGSNEPYVLHCIRVARILFSWSKRKEEKKILVTAGLLHDVVEDVPSITISDIINFLTKVGYYASEIARIVEILLAVTKIFTKEAYPNIDRKERTSLEINRMKNEIGLCKLVKLADVYDNLDGLEKTGDFAKTYIFEQYEKIKVCSGIDEIADEQVKQKYQETLNKIFTNF